MQIDFTKLGQQIRRGEIDKVGQYNIGGGYIAECLVAETQTTGAGSDSAIMYLDPPGSEEFAPMVKDMGYLNVKILCSSIAHNMALVAWEANIAYRLGSSAPQLFPVGGGLSKEFQTGWNSQDDMPDTPTLAFTGTTPNYKLQITVGHTSPGNDAHFRWVAFLSGPIIHNAYGT